MLVTEPDEHAPYLFVSKKQVVMLLRNAGQCYVMEKEVGEEFDKRLCSRLNSLPVAVFFSGKHDLLLIRYDELEAFQSLVLVRRD